MEEGLLGECKGRPPVLVRTDPITDNYAVEARPFARGKFASVRRCRHLASGAEFAAKYMRKRRRAQDVRHEILHEARVLQLSSNHPHIVRMHEVYETPSEIVLVLELVPGGELQRVLDDEEAVEEQEAARLLTQILDGVSFLHQHKIAHLDLKPQNLLLTKPFPDGEVKLCDFGISRLITKGIEIREIVGTPDYVAPEVLHYEPISLPTDMWSLGVLTYVLLSGHSPFGGDTKQETFCNITRGSLDFPPDLFAGVSDNARDFIRRLLIRNPRERMTAEECLSHSWLSGVGSPVSGVRLTLSPEGTSDDPSTPLPRRTSLRRIERNSAKTEEDKDNRLFCKSASSDQKDPSLHETSPGIAQSVFQKSPLLQHNGDLCTMTRKEGDNNISLDKDDTNRLFYKSVSAPHELIPNEPHKNSLLKHNGASDYNVGDLCKTTTREGDSNIPLGEKDSNIIFSSSRDQKDILNEPNLQHKSPLLQRNGTSDCNIRAFSKNPSLKLDQPQKTSPAHNLHRKSPLLPRNGTSDCQIGSFCKLGDTVAQSAFCKSPLLKRQNEASFSKNNSSDVLDKGSIDSVRKSASVVSIDTKESKTRSVDMVVTQFEGMSKRIVFSEEIIVDERVGMVY